MTVYEIGRMVSIVVAIIGFMTSVFLFFFLDIYHVLRMSGRKKKAIDQKKQQLNETDDANVIMAETPENLMEVTAEANISTAETGMERKRTQESVTSVLKRGNAENMTTVLQETGRMTMTLAPNHHFKVIQNVIVTHTKEKI